MKVTGNKKEPILVVGNDKQTFSVAVCLLQAGHAVTLSTNCGACALESINTHLQDLKSVLYESVSLDDLTLINHLNDTFDYTLAITVTRENTADKLAVIKQLEQVLPAHAIIAINTESLPLSALQQDAKHPERIMGANWVEPAHTTCFMEVICNETNNDEMVEELSNMGKQFWQKDPYIIRKDTGIRARMMGAMVREAFYLIENNYASVEDIDRACRNDAGYYLPFAGNFRYMDLMGTYAYGMVMKDLNPELSKDRHLPEFFNRIIQQGGAGMANNRGFYHYRNGEARKWDKTFRKFSYQIQQIITKYPFNYMLEHTSVAS